MDLISRKAFTLIEIVITIVVLGIIGAFSFVFFTNLTQTYSILTEQSSAHQEAAYILERITRELRDAKNITVSGNSISFERSNATPVDVNLYVRFRYVNPYLYRDSGASDGIYTVSKVTGKGVTAFTASPSGLLAKNTYLNISVTITQKNQSITYPSNICPANLTTTGSYVFTERHFGGAYEDKIY